MGVAYALLGEAAPAITEGEKAIALKSTSEDLFESPKVEETVAQIYAALGDADHAVPIVKRLLQTPYMHSITTGRLRVDPFWDPIRNDPRFQDLVAEKNREIQSHPGRTATIADLDLFDGGGIISEFGAEDRARPFRRRCRLLQTADQRAARVSSAAK